MSLYNPCIIIPCFNHGSAVSNVVESLSAFKLPIILIDDGSNEATKVILARITSSNVCELVTLADNQGKGGAVIQGLKYANAQGYSHAIQIDADGQHDLDSLTELIDKSRNRPETLISGKPLYDESIPRSRLYGRYLTHFWVWVETLSFKIKDSMCGFRAYPIEATLRTINKYSIGKRMDFDIEVLVLMYWEGVDIEYIDTKVIYPEGGISHFDALKDNIKISKMHTKLFFGMIPRIPMLIKRNLSTSSRETSLHWSAASEKGSVIGIKALLYLYTICGRRVFNAALKLVIGYYYLTSRETRRHSKLYLERVTEYARKNSRAIPSPISEYQHLVSFGQTMLDKLAAWKGDIRYDDLTITGSEVFDDVIDNKQGIILLGSHLGNLELCRALSREHSHLKINALVFTEHAERFNSIMKAVNPDSELNLIQVKSIGPDTAISLQQKLEQGEWIVIVGDRTSVTKEQRVIWADFLGKPAPFPQGPFLLASILKVPVFFLCGLRDDTKPQPSFNIYFEKMADKVVLPRGGRETALKQYVQHYSDRLQHFVLEAPLQWYNFFNFWTLSDNNNDKHNTK